MSHMLVVRMKRAEGALLRLLGQIGRRGYDVLGVSARLTPDRSGYDVTIEFEPYLPLPPGKPRPPEVLPALVAKLCEVEKVELKEFPAARPPAEPPGNGSAEEPKTKSSASKPAGEMHWEE